MNRNIQIAIICFLLSSCFPIAIPLASDEIRVLFNSSYLGKESDILLLRIGYSNNKMLTQFYLSEARVYPLSERDTLLSRSDSSFGGGIVTPVGTAAVRSKGTKGYVLIGSDGKVILLFDCHISPCSLKRFGEVNRSWGNNFIFQLIEKKKVIKDFGSGLTLSSRLSGQEEEIVAKFFKSIELSTQNKELIWDDI